MGDGTARRIAAASGRSAGPPWLATLAQTRHRLGMRTAPDHVPERQSAHMISSDHEGVKSNWRVCDSTGKATCRNRHHSVRSDTPKSVHSGGRILHYPFKSVHVAGGRTASRDGTIGKAWRTSRDARTGTSRYNPNRPPGHLLHFSRWDIQAERVARIVRILHALDHVRQIRDGDTSACLAQDGKALD